jgi:hypothetical protein
MSDPVRQTWAEVGDAFASLRRIMQERVTGGDGEPGDAEAGREAPDSALRSALENIVAAARQFGERANEIVTDPEVKAQTRHAVDSLTAALSATADEVGADVRGLLKRREPTTSSDADPPTNQGTDV